MTVHVHVCSVACNEFSLHKYAQNRGNSVNEICMPRRREDDDELQVHVHELEIGASNCAFRTSSLIL